jgi:membrane-bound ClpP family serine protease
MSATLKETEKLVRKQFLLSSRQIAKLSSLAASEGKSEAEIVRLAIDAFDPSDTDASESELMDLVAHRLKEAIRSTKHANKVVSHTLKKLHANA